jgi:hypothetical protein
VSLDLPIQDHGADDRLRSPIDRRPVLEVERHRLYLSAELADLVNVLDAASGSFA